MPGYTLDLGEIADELLTNLANQRGCTKSEILRRALAVYAYLLEQLQSGDTKVSITDLQDLVLQLP